MSNSSVLRVYITGTPGTGKTSVAKDLSHDLNLEFLELNDLIIKEGLYFGYDIDRESYIVDDDLLKEELLKKMKKKVNLCLSGGMVLQDLPIDYIIILHTSIHVLRNRLEKRDYSKEKIESNIEAEIMNVLYYDFTEFYPSEKIFEVHNDDRSVQDTCEHIKSIIRKHHLGISQ